MGVPRLEGYYELTETTAIEYAKNTGFFEQSAALDCEEIGDGNLNYVFHIVERQSGISIIIKQALPYAKVVGESWPLTLHRATIESNALNVFAKFVPDFVPKVHFTDEVLALTVMEDLSEFTILREGLIQGNRYPKIPEHIGTYLAKTLFYTSDFGLNQQEKKELAGTFINPELCKITEDLVFTDPFYDKDTNDFEEALLEDVEAIWSNDVLKLEVAKLKKKFLTQGEALLHGDLHTGSVFVTADETKVIDPEFAFYGPIGFDVGQFLANLLLNALSLPKSEQAPILDDLNQTWDVFVNTFKTLWHEHNVEPYAEVNDYLNFTLTQILQDSLGFAGCELIRRTIGLAHVKDLDGIENDEVRIAAKRQALSLGRNLILQKEHITHPRYIRLY